jgi:predicted O-linked N-acetylglucosamine transferase (SPINDLY family)
MRLQAVIEEAMRHHRRAEGEKAEALYRRVLAEDPGNTVAVHLLGALLLETGRNAEAAHHLREAVSRLPGNAVFFANLGEAHRRLGDADEAVAALDCALYLRPDFAEVHYTLGLTLLGEERFEEAIASFSRAIELKASLLAARMGLAQAFHDTGRLDDARLACQRALDIDPRFAEAHAMSAAVLKDQGQIGDAVAAYRRAIELDPAHHVAHGRLVYALLFDPDQDSASIARETREWGLRHGRAAPARHSPHASDSDPQRRLRIGYVSADFRLHSVAHFLIPLLEHHDRRAVTVFGYSCVRRPDSVTERVGSLCDHFRDISRVSDHDAAKTIRTDRIDLLFDLTMHTSDNRLRLFARRPAPVQATWLAYPGTTGLEAIDYRLTDVFLDPPNADVSGCYTEASIRLPDSFWCYDPLAQRPQPNPLPALARGFVTFGSLNSLGKTNPRVLALWSELLAAIEGSRLLLHAQPGEARRRVLDAFEQRGVDSGRIEFVPYGPRSEYLAHYERIDVALDTFPYNGGTTSLDALWMGVPVVTLVGRTVVGRMGLSLAHNIGLEDLVASSPEQYVEIAVRLAGDLPQLARMRAELRGRLERSPLMDGARFARNFESACRSMWRSFASRASDASAPRGERGAA